MYPILKKTIMCMEKRPRSETCQLGALVFEHQEKHQKPYRNTKLFNILSNKAKIIMHAQIVIQRTQQVNSLMINIVWCLTEYKLYGSFLLHSS